MQKSTILLNLDKALLGLILTAALAGFILIQSSYAFEANSFESTINQAPTADALAPNHSAEIAEGKGTSETQDFLNHNSPLSKPTNPTDQNQNIDFVEVQGQGKQCSSSGSADLGSQSCLQRNNDGSFAEIESQWETFGNEAKKQIITKNYNIRGDQVSEETLRIKTDHRELSDGSFVIEKETIDIVKQPAQGLTTRDLVVKNYEKGQHVKTTWAHYLENPSIGSLKASIAHHAVLYYEHGELSAGFANKYKNGRVDDVLLNYNPKKNPNLRIELTGITQWASWIDQLIQSPLAAI